MCCRGIVPVAAVQSPARYNSAFNICHTFAATILAPSAVGCIPSAWLSLGLPPTPASKKGTRDTLFFSASLGNKSLKLFT